MADFIRKITDSNGKAWPISADYLGTTPIDDVFDMIHGAIETYVIPTTKSSVSGYTNIVDATTSTVTTTQSVLKNLTGCTDPNGFRLGDVVLVEASSSDGTKVFDRWVSAVTGTSDSSTITLSVLETQVATHHHTIPVASVGRTISSSKALTSATPTNTTANVAKVGTAVANVITGTSGSVVTSVTHDNTGSHALKLETGASTDYGHSHTVNEHSHSVTVKPNTFVSRTLSVIYSLTSKNYTPHTHTNATVVGTTTNASSFTYATGEVSASATFIKTLKDSASTTGANTAALATGANTAALTTSTQASTDTIGSIVLTQSAGAHTHSLSASTESAIKTLSLQGNVVTSVKLSHTKPTVQANVVTSVTKVSKTAVTSATLTGTKTFISTWTASVDDNGVLSFTNTTGTVGISAPTTTISAINTITSGTQTAGNAASLSFTSGTQTFTSGTLTVSGSATSAGGHQHGFSHTHAIPSHTHSIASHTHSYNKSVQDGTGSAITSLKTASHTPHTHTNATVAGAHVDGSAIKIVDGGSSSSVVRELKNTDVTLTCASSSSSTNTVYTKVGGTITFPGITVGYKSLGTTSITPAVDSGEKAIKSISYVSSNFLTGVTITTASGKTGKNIGGE